VSFHAVPHGSKTALLGLFLALSSGGILVAGSAYLDRCSVPGDCASNLCVPDLGGTSFCSRTCSTDGECADGHLCVGGHCVADDSGKPCVSGATCASGLCIGGTSGHGHCTRLCQSALGCPSGYGCMDVAGTQVCVNIEVGCAACPVPLCVGSSPSFCTSVCATASSCPPRFPAYPPYTCESISGTPVCVPPGDVVGTDPIGTPCTGDSTCRSDLCLTSGAAGAVCSQVCNARGGCGPGTGCVPIPDGSGGQLLACDVAGNGDLETPCSGPLDCRSGLCDSESGTCTRLCSDGLCPSGFSCSQDAIPICVSTSTSIFSDGFESGDTGAWSNVVP
jgi:hypothetical protein